MSELYIDCSGNTTLNITVTLAAVGTCEDCTSWFENDYVNSRCYQHYTLTLSEASPNALTVILNASYIQYTNGVETFNGSSQYWVEVPANTTTYNFRVLCHEDVASTEQTFDLLA